MPGECKTQLYILLRTLPKLKRQEGSFERLSKASLKRFFLRMALWTDLLGWCVCVWGGILQCQVDLITFTGEYAQSVQTLVMSVQTFVCNMSVQTLVISSYESHFFKIPSYAERSLCMLIRVRLLHIFQYMCICQNGPQCCNPSPIHMCLLSP